MPTTNTLLSTTTLGSTATTVSFTNISAGYSDLKLMISAKSDVVDAASFGYITFNDDTTGVYTTQKITAQGYNAPSTGSTSNATEANLGVPFTGTQFPSTSSFSANEIYIPNYVRNDVNKIVQIDQVAPLNNSLYTYTIPLTVNYSTTTTGINKITIVSSYGNFPANSTFSLYGIWSGTATTLPLAPTIGTATAGNASASVTFTPAGSDNAAGYEMVSSPGSIKAIGTTSPITVSGLTNGTAYTFQVKSVNPGGESALSSASNSVTPVVPAAFESIQTITTSGGTSVTFSAIPQTYKDLQLRVLFKTTNTGNADTENLFMYFNGSNTGTAYSYYNVRANGAGTAGASSTANTNQMQIGYGVNSSSTAIGFYAPNIINIAEYASTVKNKTVSAIGGVEIQVTGQSSLIFALQQGNWSSTAAITSITLSSSANSASGVQYALYGIKG